MSKKAVYAHLIEGFFIKGIPNGNFTPTLPNPDKTLKNFTMMYQDNGDLLVQWDHESIKKSFIVPQSNIKCILLEDQPLNAKNNNDSKE